jgi:hypothetical protein
MGRFPSRPEGARRTLAVAGLTLLATAAVVAAFLVLGALLDQPFGLFSRDAAAVLHGPWYVSWLSHLVSLVWNVAAAVTLFASAVLRRAGYLDGFRLLLAGGMITQAMGLDDLLLLHEGANKVLGLPEGVAFVVYGLLVVAFAVVFRQRLGHAVLLIGGTLVLWVASAGVDLVADQGEVSFVAEDGPKIAGVALWVVMLARLTWAEITAAVPAARDRSDEPVAGRPRPLSLRRSPQPPASRSRPGPSRSGRP